jgi:hypothetical protein
MVALRIWRGCPGSLHFLSSRRGSPVAWDVVDDAKATDPGEMFALLLGIPDARALGMGEDDAEDVDLRLVIEIITRPLSCGSCGTPGTEIGRVVEELGISSAGENVIRVLWSRRRLSCSKGSCGSASWLEDNDDVAAFVERIAQSRPIRFN